MKIATVVALAAMAMSLDAASPPAAPDAAVFVEGADAMFHIQIKPLANRLLASAGVTVSWQAGKPARNVDGLVIGVQLVSGVPPDCSPDALARTYPFADGVRRIAILRDRVRDLAAPAGTQDFRLTAHVLVHEIAHVLQRLSRHSESGILKAKWTRADLELMARGHLPFTPRDVELIRAGLESHRSGRLPELVATR
jgi:hypothetical protein